MPCLLHCADVLSLRRVSPYLDRNTYNKVQCHLPARFVWQVVHHVLRVLLFQ